MSRDTTGAFILYPTEANRLTVSHSMFGIGATGLTLLE